MSLRIAPENVASASNLLECQVMRERLAGSERCMSELPPADWKCVYSLYQAWMRAGIDAWSLGMDASTVIQLRMAKIARGGSGAGDEAQLMISEKLSAGLQLQAAALTGGLGSTPLSGTQAVLDHYRPTVAANRRRLRRG